MQTHRRLRLTLVSVGVALLVAAFVLGIAAIWSNDSDLQGKLGYTAGMVGLVGFFVALGATFPD